METGIFYSYQGDSFKQLKGVQIPNNALRNVPARSIKKAA
jgi:hypothetical protein